MATVEASASQGERETSGGLVYDGFISYSHDADDLVAPRLQAALQRFAKPWWRRRALRIFRDDSSLTANPHLWASITDALDTSSWFVLLMSPEAARSPGWSPNAWWRRGSNSVSQSGLLAVAQVADDSYEDTSPDKPGAPG